MERSPLSCHSLPLSFEFPKGFTVSAASVVQAKGLAHHQLQALYAWARRHHRTVYRTHGGKLRHK